MNFFQNCLWEGRGKGLYGRFDTAFLNSDPLHLCHVLPKSLGAVRLAAFRIVPAFDADGIVIALPQTPEEILFFSGLVQFQTIHSLNCPLIGLIE